MLPLTLFICHDWYAVSWSTYHRHRVVLNIITLRPYLIDSNFCQPLLPIIRLGYATTTTKVSSLRLPLCCRDVRYMYASKCGEWEVMWSWFDGGATRSCLQHCRHSVRQHRQILVNFSMSAMKTCDKSDETPFPFLSFLSPSCSQWRLFRLVRRLRLVGIFSFSWIKIKQLYFA